MNDRIYTFAGITNFRDFGGYPTQDGRQVKKERLFRSAHFNAVTAEDAARLDALGVKFLVDLRRAHERDDTPNKWAPARIVFHDPEPIEPPAPPARTTGYTAEEGRAAMQAGYRRYPHEKRFHLLFGDLFRGLVEEGGPVVVHCAAGKDRTGVACALVLHALGVDRDSIFEDYLATNVTADHGERARIVRMRLEPRVGPLSDEAIAPLIGVEASYLECAIAAIEQACGSLDGYLENTLGVTPAMRARMREHLLA